METMTNAQRFYSQPAPRPVTRQDVLDGRIIKLNPALITVTDGLVGTTDGGALQAQVYAHVRPCWATVFGHFTSISTSRITRASDRTTRISTHS
jgi:hypothetical protein